MAQVIQIKRGSGQPGALSYGELAFDISKNRLWAGDNSSNIIQIGSSLIQESVLAVQTDSSTDPGASPTAGDRYLLTTSGSLNANFGTIANIGDDDIVEYYSKAITGVDTVGETFDIAGDYTSVFVSTATFVVSGSTGNDATWTTSSSSYDSGTDTTTVTVTGDITDATVDGNVGFFRIAMDADAVGSAGMQIYDENTDQLQIYTGSAWNAIDATVTMQDSSNNSTQANLGGPTGKVIRVDGAGDGVLTQVSTGIDSLLVASNTDTPGTNLGIFVVYNTGTGSTAATAAVFINDTGATLDGGAVLEVANSGTVTTAGAPASVIRGSHTGIAGSVATLYNSAGTLRDSVLTVSVSGAGTQGQAFLAGDSSTSTSTGPYGVGAIVGSGGWSGLSMFSISHTSTAFGNALSTITDADSTANTFSVTGDWTSSLGSGVAFDVAGSTGATNDGSYTSTGATYSQTTGETTVTVTSVAADDTTGTIEKTGAGAHGRHVATILNTGTLNANTAGLNSVLLVQDTDGTNVDNIAKFFASSTSSNSIGGPVVYIANDSTVTTGGAILEVQNSAGNTQEVVKITQGVAARGHFNLNEITGTSTTEGDLWLDSSNHLHLYTNSVERVIVDTDSTGVATNELLAYDGADWASTTTLAGDLTLSGTNLLTGSLSTNGSGSIAVVTGTTLTIADAPTGTTDAVNKAYVDSVAAGLDPKASVELIENASDIAGTYDNGTSGVGATLTTVLTSLNIDTIAVANGDRVILNAQSPAYENGIYDVSGVGSAIVFTRSTDFDGSPASEVDGGEFAFVTEGATYGDTGWVVSSPDSEATIGVTTITFTQFSSAGVINAGEGLAKDGNNFNVDFSDFANTATTLASGDLLSVYEGTTNNRNEKITVANFVAAIDGTGISAATGLLNLDLNDVSAAAIDVAADSFAFLDATDSSTKLESIADLMTGVAGDGIEAASGVLALDLKANGGAVIESNELAIDLGASSITGTLAVGDGGTGLTTVAKGSVIVTDTADNFTALDGVGAADNSTVVDAVLIYDATNDLVKWTTKLGGNLTIDGGIVT